MVLGVAVCYAFGTIWFMAVTGLNLATSMSYCVIPFLPGDAVKILLAAFLALRLRKPLAAQASPRKTAKQSTIETVSNRKIAVRSAKN